MTLSGFVAPARPALRLHSSSNLCRLLAHSVSYCLAVTCLELGANRKCPKRSQSDANDPTGTWDGPPD